MAGAKGKEDESIILKQEIELGNLQAVGFYQLFLQQGLIDHFSDHYKQFDIYIEKAAKYGDYEAVYNFYIIWAKKYRSASENENHKSINKELIEEMLTCLKPFSDENFSLAKSFRKIVSQEQENEKKKFEIKISASKPAIFWSK